MSAEIEITPSSSVVGMGKDVNAVPQLVSILNSKGLESVGVGKNCISPCYGQPPPCYGQPPPCYGGRDKMEQCPSAELDASKMAKPKH